MTDTLATYALWGSGDLTPENAKALLEEYIPDDVGTIYRPDRIDREHKGLRVARDWFELPKNLGQDGTVPSTDLIQSLIDDRDGEFHDEVYLLALWPEHPTHEDFDFIELAQNSGITVFDLSRALDELDLSLYSRPEPTKEEKAEARAEAKEEVKRGRGRPKGSTNRKISDPETQEDAPVAEAPAPAKEAPVDARVLLEPSNEEVAYSLAGMNLMDAIEKFVEAKVNLYLNKHGITITLADPEKEAAIDKLMEDTRPPFDGPYLGEGTKQYLWTKSSDTYRPAPPGTKPRRGEIVVHFTDEEAAERGIPPF